jgi:hypothetical protein
METEQFSTTEPLPRPTPTQARPDNSLRVVADDALRSVSALYQSAHDELERQTRQSPYVTLGIAAGIGFVVGGGLASPLGQSLLRASFRAFGGTLLQHVLNAPATEIARGSEPSAE